MTENRLAKEGSSYLRGAAHQPVDWYPWGEDAFARAKAEDKPILLDIGAVWCHWCHVIDHESYEDPEVAKNPWAGYCRSVVAPKVAKFRKQFGAKLKK